MPSRRLNYAISHRFVRLLARPIVTGAVPGRHGAPPDDIVYVMANRSLADIVLLDLVTAEQGLPSPLSPVPAFDETRRFFFLNRPAGWRRRNTMRTTSARMRRFEAKLAARPTATLSLVPVSIFWGRAANKDRSWIRALFSEGWAVSSRVRRFMILLFNRRDILVQIGEPLNWQDIVRSQKSEAFATRRTARLLRVKFRNQKVAALGPDLSHRRSLFEQILRSSQVTKAIDDAVATGAGRGRVLRAARTAARAIASDVSYPTIRFLDRLLTWFWHRIYDGIRVGGIAHVDALAETHTLIYAPCHRSHVDYLLVSYVLYHRGLMLPHIAAGDNLDLPIIGRILRGGGAFFMRRRFSGDRVYAAVFSEYLYQVFRRGHSVEYFVEGGRSRTGRLLPARSGMLRMTLDARERGLPRPIAFVPVYIGYEKIIEANAYLAELRGAEKGRETLGGVLRNLKLVRQSFGTVDVVFGKPILVEEFLAGQAGKDPARVLGNRILAGINACTFVNPVNLVALATLSMPRQAINESALKAQIELYRELIERHSDHTDHGITGAPVDEIVRHVERLGLLDRESAQQKRAGVPEFEDVLGHNGFQSVLMTWYRNNVVHIIAAPALLACLIANRHSIRAVDLMRLFDNLFPYIASELQIEPTSADRWLEHLEASNVIERRRGAFVPPRDAKRQFQLRLLGNAVLPILERFYIGVALLNRAGSGVLDAQGWLAKCRVMAERHSRLYGINAPEFVDTRLFASFLERLKDNGVVTTETDGRLAFDERIPGIVRAGRAVIAVELRLALESPPG